MSANAMQPLARLGPSFCLWMLICQLRLIIHHPGRIRLDPHINTLRCDYLMELSRPTGHDAPASGKQIGR